MRKYAIIVAGGVGTRMRSEVPKQFLLINDRPIIVETILKFHSFDPSISIIVVLPQAHFALWEEVRKQYLTDIILQTTAGGATRTASVRSGLSLIEGEGLVAIHDAVRPYVEFATIKESFTQAQLTGSGVACVPLKDSIREVFDGKSKARDRGGFVLVQTPQTFKVSLIKASYEQLGNNEAPTDDASVYEHGGNSVTLVEGSYSNIKITTPDDLR